MTTTTITNQRTNTEWTPYLATGIAEGFEETDNTDMVLEAWAYIGQAGLHHQLQGMFGRTLHALMDAGLLTKNFIPIWREWDNIHTF